MRRAQLLNLRHQRTLKVADEVWIATALLHRENPTRSDFEVREIVARAATEAGGRNLRPGVRVHALLHCVANRPANPGRYRMLYATGRLTRRLYRPGDPYHPSREGSKTIPRREEIPADYHELLDWYEREIGKMRREETQEDPILGLRGLGKEVWADEHPDAYVQRLREGWE